MENNFNGGQPQWKPTSMKDNLNGRQTQWKTTSMEDDINRRQPQWKTTSMEDDYNTIDYSISNCPRFHDLYFSGYSRKH